MVTFASTEHLNLRAYRDSDLPHILALWNDPRVQRVGTSEYARPRTAKWATDILAPQIEAAITAVVLELKEPCILGDNAQQDTLSRKSSGAGEQDAFVGYALLQIDHVRGPNRDATLAIALAPRCWGRGFGTEVVQWIVGHGFGVLGMHRISLAVLEGNHRAIALYKRVGFTEEGRRRQCSWKDGRWLDYINMGLLVHEWEELNHERLENQVEQG